MKDRDWLKGAEEIAEYLGVHPDSLRKLRRKKKMPVITLLGKLRAHPDDLDEWLRRQT